MDPAGEQRAVPAAHAGAEDRYEDWVYLRMIEREWKRPLSESGSALGLPDGKGPSARAAVVISYWTYFETRLDRMFRHALRGLPSGITKDLLTRYASIGARLNKLHRIAFGVSYHEDLRALGYRGTADLLTRTQERRNRFAHGDPSAIDDDLVADVVGGLKDEHEAWIALFNRRAVKPFNAA